MTTEFKLPELGEDIESGDVVSVLVAVGEQIEADQPVLELETEKATVEVPASFGGVVQEIHVAEGDTVKVGQPILTLEETEGAEAEPEPEPEVEAETEPEPEPEPEAEPEPEPETPAEPETLAFKLPDLGEDIEAGDIVSVLVAVGDQIEADQPVLELETDKATVEVPSTVSGEVTDIQVSEGDTVEVGQLILTVEGRPQAQAKKAPPQKEEAPVKEKKVPSQEKEPQPEEPAELAPPPEQRVKGPPPSTRQAHIDYATTKDITPDPALSAVSAPPNARRLARELGVDIRRVQGSGPEGYISLDDIKRHARESRAQPAEEPAKAAAPDFEKWGQVRREKMSNIRRTVAKRVAQAWQEIPHVTQFDKADIGQMEELRHRFAGKVEEAGGKLTITAIILKVAAAALKAFPQFNASLDMENGQIIFKEYYHIGVAVDTDRGLLIPVIRDVDQKNIVELAVELGEIAQRTRDGELSLAEMQGGSFTITNLGGIGGTNFTPIIPVSQVAILALARSRIEPVYRKEEDGQFVPRPMLPLAVSYDHRLIDGADAARFLRWVAEALEDPFLLALQGW